MLFANFLRLFCAESPGRTVYIVGLNGMSDNSDTMPGSRYLTTHVLLAPPRVVHGSTMLLPQDDPSCRHYPRLVRWCIAACELSLIEMSRHTFDYAATERGKKHMRHMTTCHARNVRSSGVTQHVACGTVSIC